MNESSSVSEVAARPSLGPLLVAWLLLLPLLVLSHAWLPPWAVMWLMAGATFQGLKLLVWLCTPSTSLHPQPLLEWMAWPGFDPQPFLRPLQSARLPHPSWRTPLLRIILGATLLWGVARFVPHPLAAGWTGMCGLILLLHFGVVHLHALRLQQTGCAVQPLMDHPLHATSLAEFWGRRWNRGFSDLARRAIFRPLVPRLGATGATAAVFLFSGYVHELAISLPAGGGYGLPMLYFLGQGAATLWQRAHPVWGRGVRGRGFTLGVVALPAFWLFPPVFVERVILPFLHVLHAL